MFCGWQLHPDYDSLAKYGDGYLSIDALSAECIFNGAPIKTLSISKVLNSWLTDDLTQNHIEKTEIDSAYLNVSIKVKTPEYGSRFTSILFECSSRIVSGADEYTHEFNDEHSVECQRI